ncbi:MAG: ArdC-like ssDNA-binding domain-containing protein [Candidatus Fimivivens sp.]|nr:ArdC-like ssDNA-binding domain-containing protein [Candidatus Fimivivens sp.]
MNDATISQADKVKALTDQLKEGVQSVFSSGKYAEYLHTLSRFHRYSFRNSMLIYLQNPDATRVAGFNAWKTLGRGINKGEKGLQILAPSPYKITIDATHDENGNLLPEPVKKQVQRMAFKVTYVFDISQTSGKELPELAHRLTGDVGEYERMMAALKKISPYPITFEPIEGSANGYCSHRRQCIVIREGVSQEQAIKTTVHEIAHALLHKPDIERDSQAFEVQAESVAYIVCQHFGIDSSQYSFGYVAGWSGSVQLEVLEQSLTVIQNGAAQIIESTEIELIDLERAHQVELTEKMIAVGLEPHNDTSDKGQNTLAWIDTSTGEIFNANTWQEVSDILAQRVHEDELYTLWQGETKDPATQEWRSLLNHTEQALVDRWDKNWKDDMKAVNAIVEKNRALASVPNQHSCHTTRQHDMTR